MVERLKQERRRSALVLHSGGLDSTAALAMTINSRLYDRVEAIAFDYSQSNLHELVMARELWSAWGVPGTVVKVSCIDCDAHKEIPGRNLTFIALAATHALERGLDTIVIGLEPDSTYRDSTSTFLRAANELLLELGLSLVAPVKDLHGKSEVIAVALLNGVPLHLTFSCRAHLTVQCRTCLTCRLYEKGLQDLFPNCYPWELTTEINNDLSSSELTVEGLVVSERGFKYLPALLSLASLEYEEVDQHLRIHTTGCWGIAILEANRSTSLRESVESITVERSVNPDFSKSDLNTSSRMAKAAMASSLWMLPRPRYNNQPVYCHEVQGHLADTLKSLRYTVVDAPTQDSITILTG